METEKNRDTIIQKLYTKPERKRELVESLEKMLNTRLDASEQLTEKAWEILRIASATFGVIAALQITLTEANVGPGFWVALAVVLVLYLCMVIQVLQAIAPRKWPQPPANEGLKYETLMSKYIPVDEDTYLTKLIVDYSGTDVSDVPGAIEMADMNIQEMAKHVKWAALLLVAVIVGLIVMAVFAVM